LPFPCALGKSFKKKELRGIADQNIRGVSKEKETNQIEKILSLSSEALSTQEIPEKNYKKKRPKKNTI